MKHPLPSSAHHCFSLLAVGQLARGGILHVHLPARAQRHGAATPCALRARTKARRAQSTALRPAPVPPRQAARPRLLRPIESAALAVRPHQVGTRLTCPHCKEQHTHKTRVSKRCVRGTGCRKAFLWDHRRVLHQNRDRVEPRSAATARARCRRLRARAGGARARRRASEGCVAPASAGGRGRTGAAKAAGLVLARLSAPRVSYLLGSAERVLHHICLRA